MIELFEGFDQIPQAFIDFITCINKGKMGIEIFVSDSFPPKMYPASFLNPLPVHSLGYIQSSDPLLANSYS